MFDTLFYCDHKKKIVSSQIDDPSTRGRNVKSQAPEIAVQIFWSRASNAGFFRSLSSNPGLERTSIPEKVRFVTETRFAKSTGSHARGTRLLYCALSLLLETPRTGFSRLELLSFLGERHRGGPPMSASVIFNFLYSDAVFGTKSHSSAFALACFYNVFLYFGTNLYGSS